MNTEKTVHVPINLVRDRLKTLVSTGAGEAVAQRVLQGIVWLTREKPDWYKTLMDVEVKGGRQDVLVQAFGQDLLIVMADFDLEHGDLQDRGFLPNSPDDDIEVALLNLLWKDIANYLRFLASRPEFLKHFQGSGFSF